jgi:membrane protease subunit (stomatin/prohibitin family)
MPQDLLRYPKQICDALNTELTEQWRNMRGICVFSVTLNSVSPHPDDMAEFNQIMKAGSLSNASMAAGAIAASQADAMRTAAGNPNGAMMGFMGLGFAQQAGGANANALFQQAAAQQAAQPAQTPYTQPAAPVQTASNAWQCACGAVNTGKFCSECGAIKPQNKCGNCGYVPEDPKNPPKFCPECGQKFN